MAILYHDRYLTLDDDGLTIRWYFFPFGSKRLHYGEIRAVTEQAMTGSPLLNGQWRIWGSGDWVHWFNLDPRRPKKRVLFVVDKGDTVKAVVTPDEPDKFRDALRKKGFEVRPGAGNVRG